MKINRKILFKNKILKLKLLETKTYKNNNKNSLKITEIAAKLKKALNVIYKYHVNNKKILFVGTSNKLNKSLRDFLKNSKHILLPKSIWLNGIVTNKNASLKYVRKNRDKLNSKFSETLFQFNKRLDLIVILDSYYINNILKESYIANIPTISVGSFLTNEDFQASFTIPGNFKLFKQKVKDHLFCLLLIALLKKINITKHRKS